MEPGMQELVGRLTALDPEASESLKVISYFDTLVAGGVGIEALLRGAAALTGAPTGYASAGRALRLGPDGARLPVRPPEASAHPGRTRPAGRDGHVWIERDGAEHANDAMVLERLAIAIGITTARRAGDEASAVEIAVNPHAAPDERATALARLRLDAERTLRAAAIPVDASAPADAPTAVIATPHGLARAVLLRPGAALADLAPAPLGAPSARPDGGEARPADRAGLGLELPADRLPESWASALIALRLAGEAEPTVDAADLGALLMLALAADGAELHPDAEALARLDPRSRLVLDALADAESTRAAASRLGMHHSSVQARATALAADLGYDPRSPRGRTRYALARTLLTLASPDATLAAPR
jgi:hypothetical protein